MGIIDFRGKNIVSTWGKCALFGVRKNGTKNHFQNRIPNPRKKRKRNVIRSFFIHYILIVAISASGSRKRSRASQIFGTMISTYSSIPIWIPSDWRVAIESFAWRNFPISMRAFPIAAVVSGSYSRKYFSLSSRDFAFLNPIPSSSQRDCPFPRWSPVKRTISKPSSLSLLSLSGTHSTIFPWTESVPFRSSTIVRISISPTPGIV